MLLYETTKWKQPRKISPHPDTPTSSIDPTPGTEMEFIVVKNTRKSNSGTKRQHQTDSDSDTNTLLRRSRIVIIVIVNCKLY